MIKISKKSILYITFNMTRNGFETELFIVKIKISNHSIRII